MASGPLQKRKRDRSQQNWSGAEPETCLARASERAGQLGRLGAEAQAVSLARDSAVREPSEPQTRPDEVSSPSSRWKRGKRCGKVRSEGQSRSKAPRATGHVPSSPDARLQRARLSLPAHLPRLVDSHEGKVLEGREPEASDDTNCPRGRGALGTCGGAGGSTYWSWCEPDSS